MEHLKNERLIVIEGMRVYQLTQDLNMPRSGVSIFYDQF